MDFLAQWPLENDFTLVRVESLPADIIQEQAKNYLGPEYPMLPKSFCVANESVEKLKEIKKRLSGQYKLRLAILYKQDLIGWTDGWQDSIEQDTFFMGASLILPEFQKKGLYSALVKKVFEITQEDGFQSISSLHIMTNNPVLIAKLKLGFSIYGFEVNARYGALVRLVYHHNESKKSALRFRAGAVYETEILDALKKR